MRPSESASFTSAPIEISWRTRSVSLNRTAHITVSGAQCYARTPTQDGRDRQDLKNGMASISCSPIRTGLRGAFWQRRRSIKLETLRHLLKQEILINHDDLKKVYPWDHVKKKLKKKLSSTLIGLSQDLLRTAKYFVFRSFFSCQDSGHPGTSSLTSLSWHEGYAHFADVISVKGNCSPSENTYFYSVLNRSLA